MREQVAQTDGVPKGLCLGSQVSGLRGICYRAVRESSNPTIKRSLSEKLSRVGSELER